MESAYSLDLKLIYVFDVLFSLTSALVAIAIPLYAYSLGASQVEIGVLGFAQMGIQIPFCIYFGRMSDKSGRIKLLLICLISSSAALTLLTFNSSLLLLYGIRLVLGFSNSIFYPVSGALTADFAPRGKMVKVMGLSSVFYGIAWATGPTISGYLIDYFQSFTAPFLLAAAITFTLYPLILIISRRKHKGPKADSDPYKKTEAPKPSTSSQVHLYTLTWSLIAVALQGLIIGVTANIFPVYSVIIGFTKTETGFFLTIINVMSVLLFLFIGRLSEHVTKINICIMGSALCAAAVMVAFARAFIPMALSLAVIGLGAAIIYPTGRAAVLDLSAEKRGSYMGFFESVGMVGMSSGSVVGGVLASYVSLEAPYYFTAAMALAVVFLLTYFKRKRSNETAEESRSGASKVVADVSIG
jgi:MFS transporter, DHA1 family, multidrug resistance protein